MSNMVGADIGELRELAAIFNARAAQLKSIESQLNWRIHSAPWQGHDVSRFVQDWNIRHRKVILGASASIASAAQGLLANAEQQEQASAAGYTGGISPVVVLRHQETSRVGTSGWPLSLPGIGLAAIAFHDKFNAATELVSKSAQVYLRAAELARIRALSARAIAGFGEKRAKELLALVPKVIGRTNGLYRVVDAIDGKLLGPLGAAFSAIDLGVYLGEEKYDMAAVSAVSLAFSTAATLAAFGVITGPALPFIFVGGAAWAVGSLVYQNRVEVAKAAAWVGEKVADTARKAADSVTGAVESVTKTVHQVTDAAADLTRRITNPLRAIFP